MKKQSRLGLILLFVAILTWFAVLRPQMNVFNERALEHKVIKKEVESYNRRIAEIDILKSKGDDVQANLRALYLALPRSSQIPEVLVMIESLGVSSGIVFDSISVGSASGSQVPVNISFTGTQSSVTTFLNELYSNIRTAQVKSQAVTSDGKGNLTFSLQMGLVYQGGSL